MAHIEKRTRGKHVSWRARYRAPDGRERSKTFTRPRRRGALAHVDISRRTARRLDRSEAWSHDVPRMGRTLGDDDCAPAPADARELNVGVARNYLLPRFGDWRLARITTSDVKAMLSEELAANRLSHSAIRRHVLVLRSILNAAIEDGRITRNPCRGVKLPPENSRPMRFLEPDEIARLVAAHPEHYRPLILTAAYVGLRWGELAGLKVERVDLLRRAIRIEEQLVDVSGHLQFTPPKTKAGIRTVTIPATLAEVLAIHFATEPVQQSCLAFPSSRGTPIRGPSFRRIWRRACRDAGFDDGRLDGLVFHELRHTAVALTIALGARPQAIKERLGHSSITVTMDRYGGLFPRLDQAIADGLDGPRSSRVSRGPARGPRPREFTRFRRSQQEAVSFPSS